MHITRIIAIGGGPWAASAAAWIAAARQDGHTADIVEGEHANNNSPVVLAGGDHYVLTRHYDGWDTVVAVDYKAVKTERGWVPTR